MNILINKEYSLSNNEVLIKSNDENKISLNTLNAILKILQLEEIKTIKAYFKSFIDSLNITKSINWQKIFNSNQKKEYLVYVKNKIVKNKKYVTSYFLKIFPQRLQLFQNITPIGSNRLPIYKHSSITGRLSICEGVNYLVMKKDERKQLRSTITGHTMMELDFNSCEPNFYMRAMSLINEDVDDIYEFISKKVGLDLSQERSKLKRSILSILYGANNSTVKRLSKMSTSQIQKIKELLNVENFEKELRQEYEEKGFIENYYGRPVLSDANIVNYWIQSSAVDYCCLSFLKFIKENKDIKLHSVIHDAILFSVPDEKVGYYLTLKKLACPKSNISIPIKINVNGKDN